MAETKERLALIINSAAYERVNFALCVAVAEASLGKEVRAMFGHGGVIRLKKGCADQVGEETNALFHEQIKTGIESNGIPSNHELLSMLKQLGGKIYACPTAMTLHNIKEDELIEEVDEVRSLIEFLWEDTKGAKRVIYV